MGIYSFLLGIGAVLGSVLAGLSESDSRSVD
jgi:hypothetical protein